MARKIIDIGIIGNDGTGDSIRDSFRKVNDNFRELYSSLGLGERLNFIGLSDTPNTYENQYDVETGNSPILATNKTDSGIMFKRLMPGNGISLDFLTNENEITINADFAEISADTSPQLGGDLRARSGGQQWRILELGTPTISDEAVNKAYADTKIARAGVDAIDPATGLPNQAFGRMTGPLVLSRDPEPDDDETYGGLVAATKRYVDNAAFGSVSNLFVALSGADDRVGVSPNLQGRALAYAYRTIEAALKKAEEIMLESRFELGPYKKVLTYNNGVSQCTLSSITTSPISGAGFSAQALMSADTVTLNNVGANYNVGDILTLSGGIVAAGGQATRIEVLSTSASPGAIVTFRIISSGVYTSIPGSTNVASTRITSGFGAGATFNVTYKVNNVKIISGGSGYSLVSVRIAGAGGSGAFGTAEVAGGSIVGITINDTGSGFTGVPTVIADLPRFAIFTNNLRTDFTGDLSTDTPAAIRGRDIREGLFLRGESSGALAQILGHSGELDSDGNELFDVDIKYGTFEIDEVISYGDITKNTQISIIIESGVYEENYPLKIPQNVAIIGDEFRRVIIKPKPGTSSSPWAFQKFRRDTLIDGNQTSTKLFGYHYLTDPDNPVYPKISNRGGFRAAAKLIELNRSFIQEEVIGWIDYQILKNISPFTSNFVYNSSLCKRDVGLILDSIVFDLKYGEYNRTVSAALKYYQAASSLGDPAVVLGPQLSETLAAIDYINSLVQIIILNSEVTETYQTIYPQIIDNAYISETGSGALISELINIIKDIMDESGPGLGSVNTPKNNDQMDVFLCNDANIVRAVTCQGHGGFMMVLDPTGQILAKSPYAQESASFSKSINAKTFAGGMFVDGFTGNLQFKMLQKFSNIRISVGELERLPNLPCSFIVNDVVYRVNYIRDYLYNKDGSTCTLILDETTPWTEPLFDYDSSICFRDVGLIIDGLGYDLVLGTNYNARKAGISYQMQNADQVISSQQPLTSRAIEYAYDQLVSLTSTYPVQQEDILDSQRTLLRILDRGILYTPSLILTSPPGLSLDLENAKSLLLANIEFIKAETIGYINSTYPTLSYNSSTCARDVGFIIEAVAYDMIYGGNSASVDAGLKYWDGVGSVAERQVPLDQLDETLDGINFAKDLAMLAIQNIAPGVFYSSVPRVSGTPATSTEAGVIESLMLTIVNIVDTGVAPAIVNPNFGLYSYDSNSIAAKNIVLSAKTSVQSATIDWVNENANSYELLMPGNRSMLANDFTQVNDLGYGAIAHNGGLVELVSVFTYYCHISYYSINGGQIRSVSGSSAHGNFALVAEGSDPLEVPTPCGLYHDLQQTATVVSNTTLTANIKGGVFLYVIYSDYFPLPGSELEVNHNGVITRYAISGITMENANFKLARLSISSGSGLDSAIPHGQTVTIRQNSYVVLTGDVVDVATRPSTALVINDSNFVYRVLDFSNYDRLLDFDNFVITGISLSNPAEITTAIPHRQQPGYQVQFKLGAGGSLPESIVGNIDVADARAYYVKSVVNDYTFTISNTAISNAIDTTGDSPLVGTVTMVPYGLALTQLRENYDYIEIGVYAAQPFKTPSSLTDCTITIGIPGIVNAVSHGLVPGSQIRFTSESSGSLPPDLNSDRNYWVSSKDFDVDFFTITDSAPIDSTSIGINGVLTGSTITGLTTTSNLIAGMRLVSRPDIVNVTATGDGTFVTLSFDQQKYPPYLIGQTIVVTGMSIVGFNGSFVVSSCTTSSVVILNTTLGDGVGGAISISTTGSLGVDPTILSIESPTSIRISSSGASDGTVIFGVEALELEISATGSGVKFGELLGDQGQTSIAITTLGGLDANRINEGLVSGFLYNFTVEGTRYFITDYQSSIETGQPYALLFVSSPFERSPISFNSPLTFKAGIEVPSPMAEGTLTIRIALTRVTSHDLLEIGTGGYADTNYPNEIYGQAVNDFASVSVFATDTDTDGIKITRAQMQERNSGRTFFVTTDQYGNFNVGPFFRVDQGTGTITFSASIALSQLDGLGFKRGATISEFSVDDSMADASIDSVPTESATRGYIERRLGITHNGQLVSPGQLIPATSGGFMPLSPPTGLSMKANMDLGGFRIKNISNPVEPTDAVNLRSLTTSNLQDFDLRETKANDILVLSGVGGDVINATVVGDITLNIDSTANTIDAQITPETITNADISPTASIDQTKLSLDRSYATTESSITGVTATGSGTVATLTFTSQTVAPFATGQRITVSGLSVAGYNGVQTVVSCTLTQVTFNNSTTGAATGGTIVPFHGISTFDTLQFTVTNGFVTVKNNGLPINKLSQISGRSFLGNSSTAVGNVSEIPFSTLVDVGGGIKKSQYTSTGFLRRINSVSGATDTDYGIVEMSAAYTGSSDNGKIIVRDSNGDFAANVGDLRQLKIDGRVALDTATTSTGGYLRLSGYDNAGGIYINDGSLLADKNTQYWNNLHAFKTQNGLSDAPITASSVQCQLLTTGGNTIAGNITGRWTLTGTSPNESRLQATYSADLAEYYEGDKDYPVGTVLVFGGEKEVTISTKKVDTRIAGVVSNTAAFVMYDACPGFKNLVALQGRVPCRVVGKICKGDLLVTSNIPGVAISGEGIAGVGTIVGKAIENYDSDHIGTIEIAVGRT
jgi:hypothetical protein